MLAACWCCCVTSHNTFGDKPPDRMAGLRWAGIDPLSQLASSPLFLFSLLVSFISPRLSSSLLLATVSLPCSSPPVPNTGPLIPEACLHGDQAGTCQACSRVPCGGASHQENESGSFFPPRRDRDSSLFSLEDRRTGGPQLVKPRNL